MMTRDELDRLLITVHLGTQDGRTKAIGDILAHDAALRQQLEAAKETIENCRLKIESYDKQLITALTELAAVREERDFARAEFQRIRQTPAPSS